MHKRLVATLLTVLAVCAHAQPASDVALRQIDGGTTVPLDPYYSYLIAGTEQDGVLQGLHFPIHSPLQAGSYAGTSQRTVFAPQWMTHPIFVLGADDASIAWLKTHWRQLRAMGAVGVVIAADDARQFKRLQRVASDVPVAPALSEYLTQSLLAAGVDRYPVLIGLDGHASAGPKVAALAVPPATEPQP